MATVTVELKERTDTEDLADDTEGTRVKKPIAFYWTESTKVDQLQLRS